MKIQLISDVHTEMRKPTFELVGVAPILLLAGDIGDPDRASFDDFICQCASRWELVLFTNGNHELYRKDYHDTMDAIGDVCDDYENVVFLDGDTYTYVDPNNSESKITFAGCTLWSHVTDEQKNSVTKYVNDYHMITANDDLITVDLTNEWHSQCVAFLREAIATSEHNMVILTHHAPLITGTSNPIHDDSPVSSAFATDLSELMGGKVKAWCFGHTHWNSTQVVNGTTVTSNQVGYNSDGDISFDPYKVIDIKSKWEEEYEML